MREGLYVMEVEEGPQFERSVRPIHIAAPGRQDYQAAFNQREAIFGWPPIGQVPVQGAGPPAVRCAAR
jgi:hypothetical protein